MSTTFIELTNNAFFIASEQYFRFATFVGALDEDVPTDISLNALSSQGLQVLSQVFWGELIISENELKGIKLLQNNLSLIRDTVEPEGEVL